MQLHLLSNTARALMACINLAPLVQKNWLTESLTDSIGYLAIGYESRELALKERQRRAEENKKLMPGVDTFNEKMAAEAEEEEDKLFRDLNGYDNLELDPVPEATIGCYRYLWGRMDQVRRKTPIKTVHDLLNQLKTPSTRKREQQATAATQDFLIRTEAGLVKTNLIKAGVESRNQRLEAMKDERWVALRDATLQAYAQEQLISLKDLWPELPYWAQYKVAMTLLNRASSMVGNLRATAIAQVMNPLSTAGADHDAMVQCAEALQVFVQRIMADDTEGTLDTAFRLNRLDPDRHGVELAPESQEEAQEKFDEAEAERKAAEEAKAAAEAKAKADALAKAEAEEQKAA